MLIIIGVLLISFASFVLVRSFHCRYDKTLDEYEDLLLLLRYIRDKIANSSMHISNILSQNIELRSMSGTSFLKEARKDGLFKAFLKNEQKFNIDETIKIQLRDYFRVIGSDLLVVEIDKLTRVLEAIEGKYKIMCDESAVKKKISSTVIICSALLIIIFII